MHNQEESEPMIVHLVLQKTIVTNVVLDILNGEVIEEVTKAVADSGSALSFFLSSETVQRCAPKLLEGIEDYPVRIHGITGEEAKVLRALTLP